MVEVIAPTDNSSSEMEPHDYYPSPVAILGRRRVWEIALNCIILLILLLVTIFGNTLVILAIKTTPKLQEQMSNLFIVNLAITDMALGVFVVATSLVAVAMDTEELNWFWCNVVCAANYICIIVSMFTLGLISIDRYIAVIYSLKYPQIVTRNRMLVGILYGWFQGVCFATAPAILNWVVYDYWEGVCAVDWHREKQQAVYYVIVAFVVCFMIPAAIMLFCYVRIIRNASKMSNTTVVPSSNTEAARQAANRAAKTIRSLLIVVLFFFICMTPFCVTKLLKVLNENIDFVPGYINLISSYFQYIASCINPFIYGIFRADFREAYKRLFSRLKNN